MNKDNLILQREKFEEEKNILFKCETDLAFFQRVILTTIPLIRKLFPEHVKAWQEQASERHPIEKINHELTSAFLQLWSHALEKNKRDLQRKLIYILQKVRGPKFEFGSGLLHRIFFDLQNLHVIHLGLPQKFPFAHLALKIVEFEKRCKNNNSLACQHRDSGLGEVCDDCLTKCHPLYQFGRVWTMVGWRKFSKRMKWSLPKKSSLKKFKSARNFFSPMQENEKSALKMQADRVRLFKYNVELYRLREAFAPTSQEKFKVCLKEYNANAECFVDVMWNDLITLEACWGLRGEKLLQKKWPRLREKSHELGLLGSNAYNICLLIWKAEEFALLDKPNYLCTYLKRKKFQKLVEIISKEIFISDFVPNEKMLILEESKKISERPPSGSDEEKFCDWYDKWWDINKDASPHQKTYKKAITHYRKEKLIVQRAKPYPESTLKTWMRNFHKR